MTTTVEIGKCRESCRGACEERVLDTKTAQANGESRLFPHKGGDATAEKITQGSFETVREAADGIDATVPSSGPEKMVYLTGVKAIPYKAVSELALW